MIQYILRLTGIGVFADFDGTSAPFKERTVIYGPNGTGKTTLSRVIRCMSSEEWARDATKGATWSANFKFNNKPLTIDHTSEAPGERVMVFNADYVERVVAGGGATPIVIGDAAKALVDDRARLQSAVVSLLNEMKTADTERKRAESNLSKSCRAWASTVSLALNRVDQYNGRRYNQDKLKKTLDSLTKSQSRPFDEESKLLLSSRVNAEAKEQVPIAPVPNLNVQWIRESLSSLLQQSAHSVAIERLKELPTTEAWVQSGIPIHKKHDGTAAENCEFCGQPILTTRWKALEQHFDKSYTELATSVDALHRQIKAAIETLKVSLPDTRLLFEDLRDSYAEEVRCIEKHIEEVRRYLTSLQELCASKRSKLHAPSETALPDQVQLEQGVFARVNQIVQAHNRRCIDLEADRKGAAMEWERRFALSVIGEFGSLTDELNKKGERLQNLGEQLQREQGMLREVESKIAKASDGVEALNDSIALHLGHRDLQFDRTDGGYSLRRGGGEAKPGTLSEGERKLLALLHFLMRLEDRSVDLPKTTVVLDDPVSSFDEGVLYTTFGSIRSRLDGSDPNRKAKQIIISTHSFQFLRLVSDWFRGKRPTYLRLSIEDVDGMRRATLSRFEEGLRTALREYNMLFSHVHGVAIADELPSTSTSFMTANVCRRLLESFLSFRQPGVDGAQLHGQLELLGKGKNLEQELAALLPFTQEGSHGAGWEGTLRASSQPEEVKKACKALMKVIAECDGDHFRGMIELLKLGSGTAPPHLHSFAPEEIVEDGLHEMDRVPLESPVRESNNAPDTSAAYNPMPEATGGAQ